MQIIAISNLSTMTPFPLLQELKDAVVSAAKRDEGLSHKQLLVLVRKANDSIGAQFFWEWFVDKYGVPSYGDRGFGASGDTFAYYYFKDFLNEIEL